MTDKITFEKNPEEILLKKVGKLALSGLKWKSLDDRKKLIIEAMEEYASSERKRIWEEACEAQKEVIIKYYSPGGKNNMEKTDNEIIAEFMGAKFINDAPDEFPNGYYYWPEGDWSSIDEFDYDTSWDWLMPVVEKIRNIWNTTTNRKQLKECTEIYRVIQNRLLLCEISGVYEHSIEFIKWYQTQPK